MMKSFFISLAVAGLLFAMPAQAKTITALIYCPAISIKDSSNEDKAAFLDGLVPDNVVNSAPWQAASLSERYQWARDNDYVTPYMVNKDLIPIIRSILTDKYDVLINYMKLVEQNGKYVFQVLLDSSGKLPNIRAWIDSYNEGKAAADRIWYWYGDTAEDAYAALWKDEAAFAHAVAERVLLYPVQVDVEGETVMRRVSVYDAINTYGVTINPQILKKYGMRLKLFEG
jgi:hypothetical protein